MLGAYASRNSNVTLASLAINFFSLVAPALVLIIIAFRDRSAEISKFGKYGLVASICAGLSVGLAVVLINKSFSINKVGIVIPLVFAGVIILSTLLSVFIFKEKVTLLQGLGLGVIALGFGIVTYAKAIQP